MVMARMMTTSWKVKSLSEWRRLRSPRHDNDKNMKKNITRSSDPGVQFALQDEALEDNTGGSGRSGQLTWQKDR